jgi:hypothetical protein
MATPRSVLRQRQSLREGSLPSNVIRMQRPPAFGRAIELVFLRWEKRSLAPTEAFWRDFGMFIVSSTGERIVARGTGPAAAIAMASKGSRNRFLGAAFRMSDDTNLGRYIRELDARWLDPGQIPGGGRGIELFDPVGRSVWLLQGQAQFEPIPLRSDLAGETNTARRSPRINRGVRAPIEPAQIVRLGHLVLQGVDFQKLSNWYLRVLGLIPTDVQYLADGSPNIAFCRLDLGQRPADHHTVVFVGGIEDKYEHSAYEVLDLDALGQGQQVMRAQGYRHMWGIGRHLLGSQLFDYWYDPDGFEHEHYTDGDLFTADFETEYSPLEFGGIWAWGDDAPASMRPAKNLGTLVRVMGLLRRKAITVDRLKLLTAALDAPARPWL